MAKEHTTKAKTFIWREELEKQFREYSPPIEDGKPNLYIEVDRVNSGQVLLNMTNLIVLFIFEKFNFQKWFQLSIVCARRDIPTIDLSEDKEEILIKYESEINLEETESVQIYTSSAQLPEEIQSCHRPSVFLEGVKELVISGLAPVLRFLLKYCMCNPIVDEGESDSTVVQENRQSAIFQKLLGFRGGCLAACAESAAWTTFCEVDMTQRMIKSLVSAIEKRSTTGVVDLPLDLVRFEYHLSKPLSTYNFRKVVQDQRKQATKLIPRKKREQNSETVYDLLHDFAQGTDPCLSDIVLFPSVHLSLQALGEDIFSQHLPKIANWYKRVWKFLEASSLQIDFDHAKATLHLDTSISGSEKVNLPVVPFQRLNKSEPTRDNWKMREYTRQEDVEDAFQFLESKGIDSLESTFENLVIEDVLNWDKVPELIHPIGGHLPESRRVRKGHQVANLLQMVEFVYNQKARDSSQSKKTVRIVDFCSGGGHLGMLVAWKLPNAQIILVENKSESLRRAQDRIQSLGLKNVSFFQCNLTSFCGHFDIGMALHACGSSTDLVLKKCENNGAAFVVSPCCYGSIKNTSYLQYPRSSRFGGLSQRQYLILTHSSDQTHDETIAKTPQGFKSMKIVDSDRLAYFQERDYKVWLKKMIPETASPKNHILVGIPPEIGSHSTVNFIP